MSIVVRNASTGQYTLPTASSSTKGGVKIGSGLQMNGEVLSVSGESATTETINLHDYFRVYPSFLSTTGSEVNSYNVQLVVNGKFSLLTGIIYFNKFRLTGAYATGGSNLIADFQNIPSAITNKFKIRLWSLSGYSFHNYGIVSSSEIIYDDGGVFAVVVDDVDDSPTIRTRKIIASGGSGSLGSTYFRFHAYYMNQT